MSPSRKILIVDDEFSVRDSLKNWFIEEGYQTTAVESSETALKMLTNETFDLVLLDIRLPGMSGLELQEKIRSLCPDVTIIIMTAFASIETAIKALKLGAFDYIVKPFDPDELSHTVANALKQKTLENENKELKEQLQSISQGDEIIGNCQKMNRLKELIKTVAPADSNVLIRGESGTGKELVARAIHLYSERRFFPIIAVNCGALTESLLESELFGHEKGAFTGARYRRKGKIELAQNGTLFLDEIGDITPKMQVDLLRVIENKKIVRLGGHEEIDVDFRLICATNKNLEALMEEGQFREDLFYRINVVTLHIPPLRERKEDIIPLANHFLNKYAAILNKPVKKLSDDSIKMMMDYNWPGNVRELENCIERVMVIAPGNTILPEHIPFLKKPAEEQDNDILSLQDLEKQHIKKIISISNGNMSQAARLLGIERATLYNKIKKYKLDSL